MNPASPPTQAERSSIRRAYIIQRIALYGGIILLGNVLSYLPLLYRYPDWWQLEINLFTTLLAALSSFWAYRLARKGKLDSTIGWIIVGLAFVPLASVPTGINAGTILGAALAVLLLGLSAWPNRWEYWLPLTLGYAAYSTIIALLASKPASTPEQLAALRSLDGLAAAIFGVLMLYEITRALPHLGIRSRLLVSSLTQTLVPVIIIAITSAYFSFYGAKQQITNQLTSVAQLKANQISLWEENLQSLLETLTDDPQAASRYTCLLQSDSQEQMDAAFLQVDQQLRQNISDIAYFNELFLVNREGEIVYSTDPARQGQIFSTAPSFQTGMQEPSIQPAAYDPKTQQVSIVVFAPIQGETGKAIGILAGRANLQVLNGIMQERAGLGDTGETYLVGLNHTLLTDIRQPGKLFRGDYVSTEGITRALQSQSGGAGIYPNYAGEEVIGVYTWLPELQVALLAERQTADAFYGIYRNLFILVALALLAGLFAAAGALVVTHSISTPLAELAHTAERISAGNIEVQATIHSQDEIGTLAAAFNTMTSRLRSLITTLEERVSKRTAEAEERSRRLEAVAQIGNAIASIRDLDTLLERVTHLISQQMGFYHVGIFLLDENNEYAVLRAANSEGGQKMLARGHRLRVGEVGIVGYVTAYRRPRIALDVGEDAVYFDNPDLPETHSEAALPLISGRVLLGALDVQSTVSQAFREEDIHILQLLADQLAVAIENTRLFAQTQQALEEAQRAYGDISQKAWLRMLEEGIFSGGYRNSGQGTEVLPPSDTPPPLAQEAIRQNAIAQEATETAWRAAVPLRVRGTIIGTVETYKPRQNGRWAQEELATLQNIVNELGQALEGARLHTETQLRAENERRLAEIATQVRASLDTEDILQTAVRQIQQAFSLAEVEIRMEIPTEE